MSIINFSSEVLNSGNSPSIKADTAANLPASAALGAIYITTDTNVIYRWNGSSWISIGGSTGAITGSGTANYIPQFTGTSTVGNSTILFTAGSVGVAPSYSIGTNTNLFTLFTGSAAQPIGLYIYEAAATGFNIQRIVGAPNYNSIYSGNSDIQIRTFDGATNYDTRFFKNGNIAIGSNTDNGNKFQVTGTGYFSGNIGVGTATPGAPLDIHGTGTQAQFNGTGTNNSFIVFQNAGTGKWRLGNNYSGATNYFSIYDTTNSVETLKITAGAGTASLATYQGNFTAAKGFAASGSTGTILYNATITAANELAYYASGTVTGNAYLTYANINATGSVINYVSNINSSNTAANAIVQLSTNSATGGDPYVYFQNGVTQYLAGMANADNDIFKIQNGTGFTTTPAISVFTNNRVAIGKNTDNGKLFQVAGTFDVAGDISPATSNTYNIGSASGIFASIYVSSILSGNTSGQVAINGGQATNEGMRIYATGGANGLVNLSDSGGFAADNKTILKLDSTTRGFLPPRMTTTQKNAITTPTTGLIIFDTTLAKICVYTGAAWQTVTSA